MTHEQVLEAAGLTADELSGGTLVVRSPIDGAEVACVRETTLAGMPAIIARSREAFLAWREVPAPRRGELVRLLGEELRAGKDRLGAVVTLEAGKIISEGPWRSAGNDRHLRLCGRAVSPVARQNDLFRAPRPPNGRNLAPDGPLRRHHGVQFPGRGVVLECGAGAGMRRSGDLEAFGKDAAYRVGNDEDHAARA